jgi:hypothetical protein
VSRRVLFNVSMFWFVLLDYILALLLLLLLFVCGKHLHVVVLVINAVIAVACSFEYVFMFLLLFAVVCSQLEFKEMIRLGANPECLLCDPPPPWFLFDWLLEGNEQFRKAL